MVYHTNRVVLVKRGSEW